MVPTAQTGLQSKIIWGSRLFALLVIPFTASLPAALFMYWIPSNIWNIIQLFLINSRYIRKKFNIPDVTPPDLNIAAIANKKPSLWKKIIRKFKGEQKQETKLLSYQELMELKKKNKKK